MSPFLEMIHIIYQCLVYKQNVLNIEIVYKIIDTVFINFHTLDLSL